MKRVALLMIPLIGLCVSSSTQAIEIRRWERIPLMVPLVVGQERVIFVDRNVRVAVPGSIAEQLTVQSAGGAVYLRATEPIEQPTRLQLQDAETGMLILLDITATTAEPERPALEPIRIVDGNVAISPEDEDQRAATRHRRSGAYSTHEPGVTPIAVVLTRYAAQSLYAPLRTVEPVVGISRVPARGVLAIDNLLPTLPVRASVLAAWRLDDHWVTAVMLRNTSKDTVDLDPRVLVGDFLAATFQHHDLGPTGDATDTTVLYVVTRGHGLGEAVLPVISPIDASKNLPSASAKKGGSREK